MSALAVDDPRNAGLPRLLQGAHHDEPLPALSSERLLAEIESSGLTGRGGAGFPAAAKLRTVARGRAPVVVANGTEGEPASAKDKVLLAADPHLVIDGAVVAARLVGAREIHLAAGAGDPHGVAALHHALAERRDDIAFELAVLPDRFIAGEESALVNFLNGGPAKPTIDRPYERGVRGRPTLVQNVETLANLALIARYGAAWFRRLGTDDEPGTALVTALGAVRAPGVAEIELGMTLREVLQGFGGLSAIPQAFLLGGYFGTWVAARDVYDLPFTNASLGSFGASLGARTVVALPQEACGLAETARVVRYLADESAQQCGPCFFGLPAIAAAFETLAAGGPDTRAACARLAQLVPQVEGRGACAHPTGASRLVRSALRVFAHEIELHRAGSCSGAHAPSVLPIPERS